MKIKLTQGQYTEIDSVDWELLKNYKWHVVKYKHSYYAATKINGTRVMMHRMLLGCKPYDGIFVDHKNGDGLINRRYNIKKCDILTNNRNRRKSCVNTTGKTGVYYRKRGNCRQWLAAAMVNGKLKHKSFSVNKHGYDNAKIIACKWRNEMEQKLSITTRNNPNFINGGDDLSQR